MQVWLASEQAARHSHLSIATSTGTLSADVDALFYIASDVERTHVACVSGKIDFQSGEHGNLITVQAGQWFDWKKGEFQEPRPVASSAQMQDEINSTTEAAKRMIALFAVKQDAVPAWVRP
jgi:hypothetical protein